MNSGTFESRRNNNSSDAVRSQSNPSAKPFRNRGFIHFPLVAESTPDRALGLFAFHPGAEPPWQPDFTDDESDSGSSSRSDGPWPPDHLSSIRDMVAALKDFVHITVPPYNPLSDAIKILREHRELTSKQRVDISDFLAFQKNDRQALVFIKLDKEDRAEWLQRKLSKIAEARG